MHVYLDKALLVIEWIGGFLLAAEAIKLKNLDIIRIRLLKNRDSYLRMIRALRLLRFSTVWLSSADDSSLMSASSVRSSSCSFL